MSRFRGTLVVTVLALAGTLQAHGGKYLGGNQSTAPPPAPVAPPPVPKYGGPTDVTPPPGPIPQPRVRTGGPPGPVARPPGQAAGSSSGPVIGIGPRLAMPGAASGSGPLTPGRGIQLGADLTSWHFWWEFNKDPYIGLKDAIYRETVQTGSDEFFMGVGRRFGSAERLRPSEAQIVNDVLPALKQVMERTEQRDIVSSVLVAMAKGGLNHPDFEILPLMADRLTSGDQEIRETAALAMGISQMPEAVDDYLLHLVEDGEAGRILVNRHEVDYRTRTFAAYGLGLVAWSSPDIDVKKRAVAPLREILKDDSIVSRDVRVAAINGLGLINLDAFSDAREHRLLEECLTALEAFFLQPLGAGEQLLQAHVPPAIAKLARNALPDRVQHYKELFLRELRGEGVVQRRSNDLARSVALALGELCTPDDTEYSEALRDTYESHRDKQTRYFCLMAMARIGGEANRAALLEVLYEGQRALEKPWAALALGVLAHQQFEDAGQNGRVLDADRLVGDTLHKALLDNKNPETVSAMAIALGLSRYREAALDLRALLEKHSHQDALAGYLCVGLALMNDGVSKEQIRNLVAASVRRPALLQQAAVALGKLGDKTVTEDLQDMLVRGEQNLAKMSAVASALGWIGDRRTIHPLKEMLFDESLTSLSRAFAAVALGGVIDKELLPWNSKIGANMNYRASVETLTDSAAGILDIL